MEQWSFLPPLVVRATGFPFELIAQLRFVETAGHIRDILGCEARLAALQRALLVEDIPAAVRRAHAQDDRGALQLLSKWRKAIGQRRGGGLARLDSYPELAAQIDRWCDLHAHHATLIEAGRASWQRELVASRAALRALADDPRLQEAILLSNPDMYAALQRYRVQEPGERVSAVRKFERRLVFYLQRLCVKNETQSFFGPVNYGRIDPAAPANLHIRRSPQPVRRRVVFASQWMVEALAARLSDEEGVQPFLRPRRTPFCTLGGEPARATLLGRALALDGPALRLAQLADGNRTVAALAEAIGEDLASIARRIVQLQRLRVLTSGIIIPSDQSDPLGYLLDWVAELPATLEARARWLSWLNELRQLLDAFADADLPAREQLLAELDARFTALCGATARRGAGAMYADRMLLFEECLGALESCTLGHQLARAITEQLQPVLRLAHTYARLQHARDQRIAGEVWRRLAPANDRVPLATYLRAVEEQPDASGAEPDALDRWLAELAGLVQARGGSRRVVLRGDELPAPDLPAEADPCWYTSLDLLIAADDAEAIQRGRFELVLGEVHPYPLGWVFPTAYFAEHGGAELGRAVCAELSRQAGSSVAAQVAVQRKNKIFAYPLPGEQIELRPHAPECRAIPLAALDVQARDGRLELRAGDRLLRLYAPLHRRAHGIDPLGPFVFPAIQMPTIDLGIHTPRIQIGQVVYQRERWSLDGAALSDPQARDFELFLELWRRKERLGLPDEVFVRAAQEPKPIYIDFTNYLLVELIDHVARQSQRLTVTEMLPHSGQLWLTGAEGRHSCEFRTVAIGKLLHSA